MGVSASASAPGALAGSAAPAAGSAAAPAPAPAPSSTAPAGCPGGDVDACLRGIDRTFHDGQHDRAVIAVYALCAHEAAPACFRAAHYLDRLGIASRFGKSAADLRRRGVELLEQQCAAKGTDACYRLGKLLIDGTHVPADAARGEPLVVAACDAGSPRACSYLAGSYRSGVGLRRDWRRAARYFAKACDAGSPGECAVLAERALAGNRARALALFQRACDGGRSASCSRLGTLLGRGRAGQKALDAFLAGCDLDDMTSCADATDLLTTNRRVRLAPDKARPLFERVCQADVGSGCFGLAPMVAHGVAGARDWGRGLDLYDRACALHVARACAEGRRERAHPPAFQCATEDECTPLCDERIPKACTRLGDLRATRAVTTAEQKTPGFARAGTELDGVCDGASGDYDAGCDHGDPAACLRLGNDRGDVDAYDRACKLGARDGCLARDLIREARRAGSPRISSRLRHALERGCATGKDDMACQLSLLADYLEPGHRQAALEAACARGQGRACRLVAYVFLGNRYGYDAPGACDRMGVADDAAIAKARACIQHARQLTHRACELGDELSCRLGEWTDADARAQAPARAHRLEARSCGRDGFTWDESWPPNAARWP